MDGWDIPGYTAVRELGTGAFGRVVLATRDGDRRRVAVKCLTDRDRRAEFRREAQLLGAVRSRHVVRLLDFVEGAAIVMEHVAGRSLRSVLQEQGALAPEAALVLFKGALKALADAHRAGVVHRDYKPDNVLVTERGVKLVDFGIAVRSGVETPSVGTPAYMSPEQWQGLPATPADDLYSATAVFYECLTGERPFQARELVALAAQHFHAPVPTDGVPATLRPLVARGLGKYAEDRPASAARFLDELDTAARRTCGRGWERRGRIALNPFALAA